MKIKKLNSRGDTIVEVLLSIAVLSLVLVISYGLANRSAQTNIAARERSEAQKYSEKQLELLRGYVNPAKGDYWRSLCFSNVNDQPTNDPAKCTTGIDDRYNMVIDVMGDENQGYTYTVTTTWDSLKGTSNELKLSYKLPATDEINPTPGP